MTELLPEADKTLLQAIAQMIVVRASGYLCDRLIRYPTLEATTAKLRHWLENLDIGGVILLGGSAAEILQRTQQLQKWAKTPLLIAADIEEGVGQRFSGATWFPPPMALSAIAAKNLPQAKLYAKAMGAITAKEALSIGINWILAPVVDVNNNPNNPVINIRAFADTPELVSELATAFILGAQQYPILTTAKHFPGHGDTEIDSHLTLPVLPHSVLRLDSIELPPFAAAIKAGVDSVMTAHLLIPAWDEDYPATISKTIITGQLRHKLNYQGLIVTDALVMAGIANYASPEELAVMAIEAGADILLMPPSPEVAIAAIFSAVKSGRLTPQRISQSLQRIKAAKSKISFSHQLDIFELSQPKASEIADAIVADSLSYGGSLPIQPQGRNLILVDNLLNCDFIGHHTPAIAIPSQLGYQLLLFDHNSLKLLEHNDSTPTLLQVFIRANPFRGNAGLTDEVKHYYQNLLPKKSISGLIIYGSPYVLDWFRQVMPPDLAWVFSIGQMPSAQAAAMNIIFNLPPKQEELSRNNTDFGF